MGILQTSDSLLFHHITQLVDPMLLWPLFTTAVVEISRLGCVAFWLDSRLLVLYASYVDVREIFHQRKCTHRLPLGHLLWLHDALQTNAGR